MASDHPGFRDLNIFIICKAEPSKNLRNYHSFNYIILFPQEALLILFTPDTHRDHHSPLPQLDHFQVGDLPLLHAKTYDSPYLMQPRLTGSSRIHK
jgi:hypothetical protein